jgi:hypothetical protein
MSGLISQMKNPDLWFLAYDQILALSSKKMIAADKMTGLDDTFICQIFTDMLCKSMAMDSGTWEGLRLMDDLKVNAPGFGHFNHLSIAIYDPKMRISHGQFLSSNSNR